LGTIKKNKKKKFVVILGHGFVHLLLSMFSMAITKTLSKFLKIPKNIQNLKKLIIIILIKTQSLSTNLKTNKKI
jgi:hypothetical protein